MDLASVLADALEESGVLRRNGHPEQADTIVRLCDAVRESARDYLWWLSESEALLRSGRSLRWLRTHYREWESTGNARRDAKGQRHYRALVVPQRVHKSAAREAGKEAARQAMRERGAA